MKFILRIPTALGIFLSLGIVFAIGQLGWNIVQAAFASQAPKAVAVLEWEQCTFVGKSDGNHQRVGCSVTSLPQASFEACAERASYYNSVDYPVQKFWAGEQVENTLAMTTQAKCRSLN